MLPKERVTASVPFQNTGVDMCGPFTIKTNGRSSTKQYVALFTCLATRSVHLEPVPHMDTDSIINAIVRFTARYPSVQTFFSDNGTNFTSADKVLKKNIKEMEATLRDKLYLKGFNWVFNPPHAPHRGGAWERLVGIFKRHLSHSLTGDTLRYDTFITILAEIQSVMNRRPLTQASTDPNDFSPLTPSHFTNPTCLYGLENASVKMNETKQKESLLTSWQRAQSRISSFWERFRREYLTLLHSRQKWRKTDLDLSVGDLVICVDEQVGRSEWRMARVVKVNQSDQFVRQVMVKKANGKAFLRDRTSLVKLELD